MTKAKVIPTTKSNGIKSKFVNLPQPQALSLVRDNLGSKITKKILSDRLSLVKTAGTIYEKNGESVSSVFLSPWCKSLSNASDDLVKTGVCGKNLCHESCWKVSKQAILSEKSVEGQSICGLKTFAEPIFSDDDVVGAVSFCYGRPSTEENDHKKIAKKFKIPLSRVKKSADLYQAEASRFIDHSKRQFKDLAEWVGDKASLLKNKKMITYLREAFEKSNLIIQSIGDVVFVCDEKGRILEANNAICENLGYMREDLLNMKISDIDVRLSKKYLAQILKQGDRSEPFCWEAIYCCKNGTKYPVEVNAALMVDASGNRRVLTVARNLTMRNSFQLELEHRVSFERMLSDVAKLFAGVSMQGDFDEIITTTLALIGNFVCVDRSYVYMFNNHIVDKTHEWCKKGVSSHFKSSQNVDVKKWSWFNKMISQGEIIYIGDLNNMSFEGASREKKYWKERDIKSLLIVPIVSVGRRIGFIGFDSVSDKKTWRDSDTKLLQVTAELIAEAWGRKTALVNQSNGEKKLHEALIGLVTSLGLVIEKRDTYTAGHQQRVSALAVLIAQELDLNENIIQGIKLGALIHDIGKNSIPAEILNRSGRLTKDEFGLIKVHPLAGYEIIEGIQFPWPIATMILQHHERLNGCGYPSQLKKEKIILEARILAVADVVEAMCSHRPYRPALSVEMAIKEIAEKKGNYYDPLVVDACLKIIREARLPFDCIA